MSLSPEGIHGIAADSYVTVDERQGRQEERLGERPEKTKKPSWENKDETRGNHREKRSGGPGGKGI